MFDFVKKMTKDQMIKQLKGMLIDSIPLAIDNQDVSFVLMICLPEPRIVIDVDGKLSWLTVLQFLEGEGALMEILNNDFVKRNLDKNVPQEIDKQILSFFKANEQEPLNEKYFNDPNRTFAVLVKRNTEAEIEATKKDAVYFAGSVDVSAKKTLESFVSIREFDPLELF